MVKLRAGLVLAVGLAALAAFLILAQATAMPVMERVLTATFFLIALVGAVLIGSHPRNPIGYLAATIGLSVLTAGALFGYALLDYLSGGPPLPLAGEAAWLASIFWPLAYPCLGLILLLFPNGRLLSPRWRWVAFGLVAAELPLLAVNILVGWPNRHRLVEVDFNEGAGVPDLEPFFFWNDISNIVTVTFIVLALASMLVRFFRSKGVERQQLKWVVFGLGLVPTSIVFSELVYQMDNPLLIGLSDLFDLFALVFFPLTMLIAISRYRLYDIDLIIRRTLLYSTLTIALALIYFATVLGMQTVLSRFVGVESRSVVIISTLLIAALFQPLRRRFQRIIDRRFYRASYNAEHTLERFAAYLRSEVDLGEIEHHLIDLVDENIRPEHASLWLLRRKS